MNQKQNETPISILSHCTSGGCGAKIGVGELSTYLSQLPRIHNPNLLVGYDGFDDAGVYKINQTQAMVCTVDFFSPMLDDSLVFGRIAATNALSDVYAMGGTPTVALNLVCFPEAMPKTVLQHVLQGGAEKIAEAEVSLAGGHSIYDKELKYGLSVTGIVPIDGLLRNNTPKLGDSLILTKALGVGMVLLAKRNNAASNSSYDGAVASMQRLNRYAAQKMVGYPVNACTDVTGFGLLVHLLEMCGSSFGAEVNLDALPLLPEVCDYASRGFVTGGGMRNRAYIQDKVALDRLPQPLQEVMLDPQTSGGLLIAVDSERAGDLLKQIQLDDPSARIIGKITKPLSKSERITFV